MIISEKTIGEDFDIIVVDHDPTVTATDAYKGDLIIQHNGRIRWFLKVDDGENTNVIAVIRKHCELTTNPTVTDDANSDFDIGSEWLNTVTGKWYKCRSTAVGAAIWDLLN